MSSSQIRTRLDAIRSDRDRRDGGFTLIELLVVVVIIGILVAIAIPLYLQYQNGAKNKSAQSDLRGGISTVETYFGNNNNAYPTAAAVATGTDGPPAVTSLTVGTGTNALVIKIGKGNTVAYVPVTTGAGAAATVTSYKLCSTNADGGNVFTYDSSAGGSVVDQGKKTMSTTDCSAT